MNRDGQAGTIIILGIGILLIGVVLFFTFSVTPVAVIRQAPDQVTPAVQVREPVDYKNVVYGFTVRLPQSWTGFSIVSDTWEGIVGGEHGDVVKETGPLLLVRHPLWTAKVPRQDIPVMVFTLSQWNSLQKGDFHIGAAPINPDELGRNSRYVFALPARYNYAFPEGFQEVESILLGKPLQAFDPES